MLKEDFVKKRVAGRRSFLHQWAKLGVGQPLAVQSSDVSILTD